MRELLAFVFDFQRFEASTVISECLAMVPNHVEGEWLTCLRTSLHITKVHFAIFTSKKWYLGRPTFAWSFVVIIFDYLTRAVFLKIFLMLAHPVVAEALSCIWTALVRARPLIVHAIFVLQLRAYVVVLIPPEVILEGFAG